MDPSTVDVCVRHRRRDLPDALPVLLTRPMATRDRCHLLVVLTLITIVPLVLLAAQPAPDLFNNLDALRNIPAPSPISIRPRLFASYGALITAVMLGILYL